MELMYMQRALELAKLGAGYTKPGPLIGAVIVKNSRIIGEGYSKNPKQPSAEVMAVENASESIKGADLFINIEPWVSYKGTQLLENVLASQGINRVVIGMENPDTSTAWIEKLKATGIKVETGILEEECRKLNEIFIKYVTTDMPFCILKTAMTWDGKIAPHPGEAKLITNELSRQFLHKLRHRVSAVMVGVGTVLKEDPLLTTRLENMEGRDPLRIIIDSSAKIPLDAKVLKVKSGSKTVIAVTEKASGDRLKALSGLGAEIIVAPVKDDGVDLCFLVKELRKRQVDSVLIEGGCTLSFAALDEGIIDKVISFIAPRILGGDNAKTPVGGGGRENMKDSMLLKNIEVARFGEDIMIEGYLHKDEEPKCEVGNKK